MPALWQNKSDGQLLQSCGTEAQAFAELYRRYEVLIAGFLLRQTREPELAADLTAETFAKAFVNASKFRDEGQPAVGWLLGIARYALLETLRKHRTEERARRRLGAEPVELTDQTTRRMNALFDGSGFTERLEDALATLPPDQRQLVLDYVVGDLSYAELAGALGVPEATVRQRVSRGLRRLRTSMDGAK